MGGGGVGAVSCIEVGESDMHTVNYVHFTFLQTIQRSFDTILTYAICNYYACDECY